MGSTSSLHAANLSSHQSEEKREPVMPNENADRITRAALALTPYFDEDDLESPVVDLLTDYDTAEQLADALRASL